MAAFVPLPFCSHSLMDRISDSGSDGLGSNPDGSTKNAFIGIYRPYRGKKRGKVLQKTLPLFFILCCFMSLAVPRETIDIEHMIWKGRIPCTPAGRIMRTGTPRWGDPFHLIRGGPERAVFRQFSSAKTF